MEGVSKPKVVLATKNPGKAKEIRSLMGDLPIEIVDLEAFPGLNLPSEDGETFADNALRKAEAVAEATGLWALADDSGLEVDCLNGRPGVFSARYAGEGCSDQENNRKLLEELRGVPIEKRRARYRCVVALVGPHGERRLFQGECEGLIADLPRGEGGFGYDPLFLLPEKGKTMAELDPEEKNRISHRGKALRKCKEWLRKRLKRS